MKELERYIDRLFCGIERTRETKKLKGQITENAREKYEALLSEGLGEEEALCRVISDIGTEEDLKAEYPPRNTALRALTYLFLVLFAAGAAYAVYCTKNAAYWKLSYNIMPLWIFSFFVKPAMFLSGTYLVMFFAGKLSPALGGLAVGRKPFRLAVLAVCLGAAGLYYFAMANVFLGFVSVNRLFFWIALNADRFNGYAFLLLGLLLYFGVKK